MRPLHKIYCLILLGFWQSGRLLIAYELGDTWGTVTPRTGKLKELVLEFLETIADP